MILLLATAFAQDDGPVDDEGIERALGGGELPALPADTEVGPMLPPVSEDELIARGAEQLGMDPQFVRGIRQGLERIYLRDYDGASRWYKDLETQYPNTGVAAVADTLIWQARMLENFDFQYDKQYWAASKKARKDLDVAIATPGNDAWEYFMLAGISGIESIHTMRRGKYISALQLAFEAVDHVEKTRELAPNFADLALADGMYNYWRTVVTMSSSLLPDFGDHRTEGLQQIQSVVSDGIFLGPPARLALVFSWIEEGKLTKAIDDCKVNQRAYPDNVINNLVLGTAYIYKRKYPQAVETFDHVLKTDPSNKRVHYYRGLALMRNNKLDDAQKAFETYIAFEYMEDYQRAGAWYRLGQTLHRKREYAKADEAYHTGQKMGSKKAKKALDRLRKKRKAGQINY